MATFNVSALAGYVDQLKSGLIRDAVVKAKTFDYISVQEGVKGTEALTLMNSTVTVQSGFCTAINPSGGPVLSQRNIAVCDLHIDESICLADFEKTWMGKLFRNGANQENLPADINAAYAADKVAKAQAAIEKIFWQGDTGGSGNLATCNGMIKLLNGASGVIKYGASSGTKVALTSSNAILTVESMIAAMPEEILDEPNLVMFMSNANFLTVQRALIAANNYHYTALDAANDRTMVYPGTNVKLVAVGGLTGNFQIALSYGENFYLGTDLQHDAEDLQVWYEIKDDLVYSRLKWRMGAQVAFPQYVVLYTGVPA